MSEGGKTVSSEVNQTPNWAVWLGLLVIYVVWSSTYLAIRFAVESIPPFMMAAIRFLVAGIILYCFRKLAGDPKPTKTEWRSAGLIGLFLLVGGNGGVSFAEQKVVSGVTALIVGATPLWIVIVDLMHPVNKRPALTSVLGVLIGFVGIFLLFNPWKLTGDSSVNSLQVDSFGILILLLASLSWAIGSVYGRDAILPRSPLLATGMEMIAGGVGLFILSVVAGEWNSFNPSLVSSRSWLSLVYLILFGALLGFATYTWLLRVAPITLVSTYAYVNPLVAIFLGSVIAFEPITPQLLFSAVLIIGSVGFITITSRGVRRIRRKSLT